MRATVLVVAGLLLFSAHVGADPIVITSGSLVVEGASGGQIVLNGDSFSFVGSGLTSEAPFFSQCGRLMPCVPGQELSIHAGWGGSDLSGTVTYNGRTAHSGIAPDDASIGLQWNGQITLPPLVPLALVSAPFVFSGVMYFPENWPPLPDGSTRLDLTGGGTAELWFSHFVDPSFGDTWRFERAVYQFNAASPEPVPEPATLLMLGTGTLMIVRRARRRMKRA